MLKLLKVGKPSQDVFGPPSKDLLRAITETETDYLAFGSELRRIYETAIGISKTCSSLATMTEGERLNGLTGGLKEFLERNKDLGSQTWHGAPDLEAILERAVRIGRQLQSFQKVVRTLRVLCNFIKVESIRLEEGKDGFQALAENVGVLARNIEEGSSPVLDQSDSLIVLIKESLARVLSFEQLRRDKGKDISKKITDDLGALRARHQSSSRKLIRIKTAWEGITNSIGEIVSSLQFHDITRQRVEHVAEALREFSKANETNAYEGYLLQRAQLLHAREELASAVERIGEELRNLSRRIGDMSGEAGEVTEDARGTGATFFSGMETAIDELTRAVDEQAKINGEMATAAEQVSSAVSRMGGFLKEIVRIGIEMKMIALNAAIHAAHVGEEGLALGVLAEQIHTLSQGTSERIHSIDEDLKQIFDHAGSLKNCAGVESRRAAQEEVQMAEHLNRMIPSLRQLDAESHSLLERVEAEGDELSTVTWRRAEELNFHEPILQGIDSLAAAVEKERTRIGRHIVKKGGRSARPGAAVALEELAERYTMERERDVHRSVQRSEGSLDRSPLPAHGPGQDEGGELGENVELF